MPRQKGRNNKKKKNGKYRKANIPKAIREQCWIASFGKVIDFWFRHSKKKEK